MTSLLTQMDSGMVALLLFWAVVVVALVITSTAGEMQPPEPFDLVEPTRQPASRRNLTPLRPANGPRAKIGLRASGRSASPASRSAR